MSDPAAAAMPTAKPAPMPAGVPRTAGGVLRFFFAQWSARILLAFALISLAVRCSLGDANVWDAVIVAGLLAYWPLNEWLIHVLVLHSRPVEWNSILIDFPIAKDHRAHHADPWNPRHIFISLHVFPWTLPLLVALAWLITPDWPRAWTFLSAYAVLALHYEWCHTLAHVAWCPPLAYYARRVREHRLHHFKNERYWWGVSMGLADRLLGTAPNPAEVARSGTTHAPQQR